MNDTQQYYSLVPWILDRFTSMSWAIARSIFNIDQNRTQSTSDQCDIYAWV